jgi:cell division protein FtsB
MSTSNAPPNSSLARQPSRRPLFVVLIFLCMVFIVTYAARLGERRRLEEQITAQEQSILQAQEKNARLQTELQRANSPAFLDEIVRTVFQMGKEGETLFVGVKPPTPEAVPTPPASAQPPTDPVWRQWLELIFPQQ